MKPTRRNVVALTVLNYSIVVAGFVLTNYIPLLLGPVMVVVIVLSLYTFRMRKTILGAARQ